MAEKKWMVPYPTSRSGEWTIGRAEGGRTGCGRLGRSAWPATSLGGSHGPMP